MHHDATGSEAFGGSHEGWAASYKGKGGRVDQHIMTPGQGSTCSSEDQELWVGLRLKVSPDAIRTYQDTLNDWQLGLGWGLRIKSYWCDTCRQSAVPRTSRVCLLPSRVLFSPITPTCFFFCFFVFLKQDIRRQISRGYTKNKSIDTPLQFSRPTRQEGHTR